MKELFFLTLIFVILFILFKKKYNANLYSRFKYKFENKTLLTPLKLVDQIYCIVMPDRKDDMIKFMKQLNVNCKFLNAVTPKDLTEDDYKHLTKNELFKTTKKTRLPLQISFCVCYLDAIENGYNDIIVFEDDVKINTDTETLKQSIDEFRKSQYAMFYMGYCYLNCKQDFKSDSLLVNVNDYDKMYCAHSIVYKVKYLKSLVNYLFPMKDEFDVGLVKYNESHHNKLCIPKKVYFEQNKTLGTNNETLNPDGSFTPDPPTCLI